MEVMEMTKECMGPYCPLFSGVDSSICSEKGLCPECRPKLKSTERERIKYWCPQHGYPVPCYKCGYEGNEDD